jgi:hypothetical protein
MQKAEAGRPLADARSALQPAHGPAPGVEHGGRRLVVSVAGKLSPGGVRVTETAGEVSVTVYVRLAPPGSLIRHIIVFVSVMLDEPLGERRLIDGAG